MKKISWVGVALLFLTSCQDIQPINQVSAVKLTPYIPTVQASQPTKTPTPFSTVEPEAVPTAAPVIHVVALGETFSSIALQYGMTIDAVRAANPDANPNALIVGDELVIPVGAANSVLQLDAEIVNDVQFNDPHCVHTNDSGLWCSVLVEIVGERDLENLVVAFSFISKDGKLLDKKYVPTIMQFTPSGSTIPAVVFLKSDPGGIEQVNCSIFSGQIYDPIVNDYLSITVEDEKSSVSGKEANISGKMVVAAEDGLDRANIWLAAAAYNAEGRLVGVRRLDSEVATNEVFDFSLTVYAAEDTIDRVEVLTEAY